MDLKECRNDDVLLSFAGDQRPYCHDIGPILECLSSAKRSIATWRQSGFLEERIELYRRLREIKMLE
jgi:hypothetical protein